MSLFRLIVRTWSRMVCLVGRNYAFGQPHSGFNVALMINALVAWPLLDGGTIRRGKGPMDIFALSPKEIEDLYPGMALMDPRDLHQKTKCVEKLMLEDSFEYPTSGYKCKTIDQESCSLTFQTKFTPRQVKECKEYFTKICVIEYETKVYEAEVKICRDRALRTCDSFDPQHDQGLEENPICFTDHDQICVTQKQRPREKPSCNSSRLQSCSMHSGIESHCVDKLLSRAKACDKRNPDNEDMRVTRPRASLSSGWSKETCRQIPKGSCLTSACSKQSLRRQKTCEKKLKKIVLNVPHERCQLVSMERCEEISRLFPSLKPTRVCQNVPKEICQPLRDILQPRRIKKPVVKRWCPP